MYYEIMEEEEFGLQIEPDIEQGFLPLQTETVVKLFIAERLIERFPAHLLMNLDVTKDVEHTANPVFEVLGELYIINISHQAIADRITNIVNMSFLWSNENNFDEDESLAILDQALQDNFVDGRPSTGVGYSWNMILQVLMVFAEAAAYVIKEGKTQFFDEIFESCFEFLVKTRMQEWIDVLGGWENLIDKSGLGDQHLVNVYKLDSLYSGAPSIQSSSSSMETSQNESMSIATTSSSNSDISDISVIDIVVQGLNEDQQAYIVLNREQEFCMSLLYADEYHGIPLTMPVPVAAPHIAERSGMVRMIPSDLIISLPNSPEFGGTLINGTLMIVPLMPYDVRVFNNTAEMAVESEAINLPAAVINPLIVEYEEELREIAMRDGIEARPRVQALFINSNIPEADSDNSNPLIGFLGREP